MKLIERINAPVPKFFRDLRLIGLAMVAASGVLLAAPVVLPVALVTIAQYMAVAGGVMSAVSQITVRGEVDVLDENKE